ncbi:cytochrome c551 [Metabacillus herbersteinensis]|uniref:Cytochrome c551 n=1 Tax=Metabacillus herbersteinensis TaxID=283816 RepID=A0ABV6GI61_9BACI
MKSKLAALVFGTSLVLAACGGGGDDAQENAGESTGGTESAEAEQIVQQNCISCHGQNLEGGAGPDLTAVGGKYDQDKIKNIIINGQGSMPKGLLDDADAEVVAAWLAEKK